MAEDEAVDQPSEEELDLELEEAGQRIKRGGGWGIAIAVILLLAVLAVVGIYWMQASQAKRAEEKRLREESRTMTLDRLSRSLLDAGAQVQAGDFEAGISKLRTAQSSLQTLLAEAEQEGDEDALYVLRSHRTEVDRTLQEAEARRDALLKLLGDQLPNLAMRLSGGRIRPPASPAEPAAAEPAPPAAGAETQPPVLPPGPPGPAPEAEAPAGPPGPAPFPPPPPPGP